MIMTDKVDVNFLSIIYEIIRSFEKDSHDVTQKISELRQRFEVCREQINQLSGIDHSQAEQLQQIEILRQQVKLKNELLLKYKNLCNFDVLKG